MQWRNRCRFTVTQQFQLNSGSNLSTYTSSPEVSPEPAELIQDELWNPSMYEESTAFEPIEIPRLKLKLKSALSIELEDVTA